MYTKADLMKKVEETLPKYPQINVLYKAGDPRIRQNLEAMAAMLAMLSAQVETSQNEAFQKSRDSTVLADASMRGIVRKGTAARARIKCTNNGTTPFTVDSGRNLFDSSGRVWRVETAVTVKAGESGTFEATQRTIETLVHTVENTEPFYAIEIPSSDDESYLCEIAVSDSQGDFEYREGYVNTEVDERVYHVEADDRQRVYVRLGYDNVVGWQPEDGDEIRLRISRTNGDITVEYGTPFSFEYLLTPTESQIDLTMDAMLVAGANPVPMSVLRDMAKYPSVYQSNSVFLGEFGFLVRKNFPTLQFLSVWNETIEEQTRGSNFKNINALFVACLSAVGNEKILEADNADDPDDPEEIKDADLTDTQKAIKECIRRADDSYRVRFFTPVAVKIPMTIKARVSTSYVAYEIKAQIIEVLVSKYGKEAAASRRGNLNPLNREIIDALTEAIPALTDGNADLKVTVDSELVRPELWRYVDKDSLDVTVETANMTRNTWGG